MKKILFLITFCFCSLFGISNVVFAEEDYVILGGDSIGLKLSTGVVINGKYKVDTDVGKIKPWENSDILVGDKITEVDNFKINTSKELLSYIKNCNDNNIILTIERKDKIFDTNINVVQNSKQEKSLGLYIKDCIVGVGTLTYIDPDDLSFAALGHAVNDDNLKSNKINGNIYYSSVETIKKGSVGKPGEKRASIGLSSIGTIFANESTGVYGKLNDVSNYKNRKKLSLANNNEIKIGPAKIYTVIQDDIIKAYNVEIISLSNQEKVATKGIKIKITDQELISKTGGIIQGMSGSPIIQENKIVGAVSHVTVDNPLIGYGVYVSFMEKDKNYCLN